MTGIKTIGLYDLCSGKPVNTPVKESKVANSKKSTDTELLDLYEKRCESAIGETAKQYGAYCTAIAMNILQNREDAEECVNDTYLKAWNSIPPQRPEMFSSFLGRIARNLSLNRYKAKNAKKRGGSETALLLSELVGCIPASQNVESEVESGDLTQIIEEYLAKLKEEDKIFFIRRYWHTDSVNEIAKQFNVGVSKINTSLHRTRKKLKVYLEKRGISYEN